MACASSCHPSGIGEVWLLEGLMCFKRPLLFPVSRVPEPSSGSREMANLQECWLMVAEPAGWIPRVLTCFSFVNLYFWDVSCYVSC